MKLNQILSACFVIILVLFSVGIRAQSAEEIVARHVAALGGKEKLQSIHSVYAEGVAVMQNGGEIDSKNWKVQGKLYRQEISLPMGNVVVIVTPTQGWSSNPRDGGAFKAMSDEQVKSLQPQLEAAGPLADYAAKGDKVELLGKDTINGNECYKIKLSFPSGQYITYYIDTKTYYILRETRKGGGMMGGGGGGRRPGDGEFNIDFSDYQKTADGYVFPYTIIAGGFGARTSVEKLEVNKVTDEDALSKPGK